MMKKILLGLVFLLAANMGYAEYIWPVTDYPQQISVAGAKQLSDDVKVSLEGFITGHLRGDHYLFRDDSGEIGIEIEGDVWKGACRARFCCCIAALGTCRLGMYCMSYRTCLAGQRKPFCKYGSWLVGRRTAKKLHCVP